jgi:hypothetical protein
MQLFYHVSTGCISPVILGIMDRVTHLILLFATVLNSRINAFAQWDSWFIFNLQMKRKRSVTCACSAVIMLFINTNSLLHTLPHTYLSSQALAAANEYTLALSQSKLSLFTQHMG